MQTQVGAQVYELPNTCTPSPGGEPPGGVRGLRWDGNPVDTDEEEHVRQIDKYIGR